MRREKEGGGMREGTRGGREGWKKDCCIPHLSEKIHLKSPFTEIDRATMEDKRERDNGNVPQTAVNGSGLTRWRRPKGERRLAMRPDLSCDLGPLNS